MNFLKIFIIFARLCYLYFPFFLFHTPIYSLPPFNSSFSCLNVAIDHNFWIFLGYFLGVLGLSDTEADPLTFGRVERRGGFQVRLSSSAFPFSTDYCSFSSHLRPANCKLPRAGNLVLPECRLHGAGGGRAEAHYNTFLDDAIAFARREAAITEGLVDIGPPAPPVQRLDAGANFGEIDEIPEHMLPSPTNTEMKVEPLPIPDIPHSRAASLNAPSLKRAHSDNDGTRTFSEARSYTHRHSEPTDQKKQRTVCFSYHAHSHTQ